MTDLNLNTLSGVGGRRRDCAHFPRAHALTHSVLSLCKPKDCSPPGSSIHLESPGKDTGVGSHALLQVIFPTQGLNPGLLHWQVGSFPLRHLQQKDSVKFTPTVLHVRTSPICIPGW